MSKALQYVEQADIQAGRVGTTSSDGIVSWTTRFGATRRSQLYDESVAWETRVKPAVVYSASDLPVDVLSAILRKHGVPEVQIPRMVELTRK
jgi:hypothetical protein